MIQASRHSLSPQIARQVSIVFLPDELLTLLFSASIPRIDVHLLKLPLLECVDTALVRILPTTGTVVGRSMQHGATHIHLTRGGIRRWAGSAVLREAAVLLFHCHRRLYPRLPDICSP